MTSEPNQEGNNSINYYQKGLDSYSLHKFEEAISNFNIAIEINPNDANSFYNKGLALEGLSKAIEAVACYDKAIEIDQNNREFHSKKVLTLQKLGKGQEAVDYYDKAIEIDPENVILYEYKVLALKKMRRDELANACFNKMNEIKQEKHLSHFKEGLSLRSSKKYEEAVVEFSKAIEMNERSTYAYFYKGLTLLCLNKDQDALLCFDKTIETASRNNNPLYYCVRGRTLRSLNRQQEALTNYKKAQEICKIGEEIFLVSEKQIEYLTIIVNSLLELERDEEKGEKILGQLLDKKKFVEELKVLGVSKEKVIADLLEKIEEKYSGKIPEEKIHAAQQLREDYSRLHKEMNEELSKEVDDFYKKFDTQIESLDLGPEDKIKIKEYFKAFVGTFRSAFEGSKAIENENYQLDSGFLLSIFVSFAPKDISAITSISKFFAIKEIQAIAKNTLELFFDSSVYLNAIISKIAEKVVMNQKKREYIISVSDKELDRISSSLLKKISKFCEKMSEPIDIELYKQLYHTPAAYFGHVDANSLIKEYLTGKISPNRIQEESIEKTLKRQRIETEDIKITIKMESGKGKCCSIF